MRYTSKALSTLALHAHPLKGRKRDLNHLVKYIGDASIVLLGEASHGTHEFYELRTAITMRLIKEKGFSLIALEGDWPDTISINHYLQNASSLAQNYAMEALEKFKRFPAWMWRNKEIVSSILLLRAYNMKQRDPSTCVKTYGLDLYSLHRSIHQIIEELQKIDSAAAQAAKERYACFDIFKDDPHEYGYFASRYPTTSCEQKAALQLETFQKQELSQFSFDGIDQQKEKFYLEQNARVIKNAEAYYRSLFHEQQYRSWNIRDTHMFQTVEALIELHTQHGKSPKVIIWAHNSHIGDARATQMSAHHEYNLGQLIKERYGSKAKLVGFTTYTGSVSAASTWGGAVERKYVRPALPGSYEALFHATKIPRFFLVTHEDAALTELLNQKLLERAIGVIYSPETERTSHYFYAQLADQFDVVIHIDTTTAVVPLEKTALWDQGEFPETFPFGL